MISGSASLDEAAVPRGHPVVEAGLGVHRVEHGQVLGPAHLGVVLAERRRDVDDAGAVVVADVVRRHHPPRVLAHHRLEELEGPRVVPAGHVPTGPALGHGHAGVQAPRGLLAQDQVPPALGVGDADVARRRAHGRGHVGDERPGRGRPHQQVGVGGAVAGEREADVDRGVDHVLVALGHLVGAERGAAAPAVGGDPVALVQQPLVPQLAHEPPHRLDVVVGEGPVGVRGVDPHPGARGQRRPVLDVAGHRLAAPGVEGLDAVGLDVGLGAQAQLFLDLELDGQAVGVPAPLARHVAAPHGLEAGEQVLERPGPHVVEAGAPVGRRGPLVEDPRLAALAEPGGLLDHLALAPARERPHFQARAGRDRGRRGQMAWIKARAVEPRERTHNLHRPDP